MLIMTRIIARIDASRRFAVEEMARSVIVAGCAIALICAGETLLNLSL
jgi:hypothetical protein